MNGAEALPVIFMALMGLAGLAAVAQGRMLGHHITGLKPGWWYDVFLDGLDTLGG